MEVEAEAQAGAEAESVFGDLPLIVGFVDQFPEVVVSAVLVAVIAEAPHGIHIDRVSYAAGDADLEQTLKMSKVELEFSLWYLKECGYLIRTDSARHTITLKGVQFAEALKTGSAKWVTS